MPAEGSAEGLAAKSPCSSDKTTPGEVEEIEVLNMPKKHEGMLS